MAPAIVVQVDISGPHYKNTKYCDHSIFDTSHPTSTKSPRVAGVAVPLWSHLPTKTAQQIRKALELTARDLGSAGRNTIFGYGLVRADPTYNFFKGSGGGRAFINFFFISIVIETLI